MHGSALAAAAVGCTSVGNPSAALRGQRAVAQAALLLSAALCCCQLASSPSLLLSPSGPGSFLLSLVG